MVLNQETYFFFRFSVMSLYGSILCPAPSTNIEKQKIKFRQTNNVQSDSLILWAVSTALPSTRVKCRDTDQTAWIVVEIKWLNAQPTVKRCVQSRIFWYIPSIPHIFIIVDVNIYKPFMSTTFWLFSVSHGKRCVNINNKVFNIDILKMKTTVRIN